MGSTIDPEGVLELCKRFGTYRKVAKHLEDEGVTNPVTEKPYGFTGVRVIAMRAKGFKAWRRAAETRLAKTRAKFDKVVKKSRRKA